MTAANFGYRRTTPSSPTDSLGKTQEAPVVSRDALLDAAEAAIEAKGYARATIEIICATAGAERAFFDVHFEDRGALLRALSERMCERLVVVADEATREGIWRNAPPRDIVEVAARTVLDVVHDRREQIRAFVSRGASDPALVLALHRIGAHLSKRLSLVLRAAGAELDERAVAFALLLAVSLAHHELLVGPGWAGVEFTREELATHLSRAIACYLRL